MNIHEQFAVLALSIKSQSAVAQTQPPNYKPAASAAMPIKSAPASATPAAKPAASAFVATVAPTLTKPDFDSLSPADKSRFSISGGKIIDIGNGAFIPTVEPTISKAQFDQLTPFDKLRFSLAKGKITD